MVTYVVLNILFMAAILALLWYRRVLALNRVVLALLVILVLLTVVFDSFIISSDIVDYDSDKILNVYLWRAPLEDFAYSVLAALAIPAFWKLFKEEVEDAKQD